MKTWRVWYWSSQGRTYELIRARDSYVLNGLLYFYEDNPDRPTVIYRKWISVELYR